MATKRIHFVGGGVRRRSPLVAVPTDARLTWRDDAGRQRTARAKTVKGVAVLDLDGHPSIVLGPKETGTTWMPTDDGGVFVRWIDGRGFDHECVPKATHAVPPEAWRATDETLELAKDRVFALFAAAISDGPYGEKWPFGPLGKQDHPFGWIAVPLAKGMYAFDVVDSFTAFGVTIQCVRVRKATTTTTTMKTKTKTKTKTKAKTKAKTPSAKPKKSTKRKR